MDLSDFPISKVMFGDDEDVEVDSRYAVMTGDGPCAVTGEDVPPSDSHDLNTLPGPGNRRMQSRVLFRETVLPGAGDNDDDLQSADQTRGTHFENENHDAGDAADNESTKGKGVEEKGDPAISQTLAKLLITTKIRNRRPTPWPNQLEGLKAAREAYELETHHIQGQHVRGHRSWRICVLASGPLLLVINMFLRRIISMPFATQYRCLFSTASQRAVFQSAQMNRLDVRTRSRDVYPGGVGGEPLLQQFLQVVRSLYPYTPDRPAAQWIFVISHAALVTILIWKLRYGQGTS